MNATSEKIEQSNCNIERPIFTAQEVELFERSIDKAISNGYQQITLSTNYIGLKEDMRRYYLYLGFYYPAGSFSPNPYYRNIRIAKNGKKYQKKENW